MYTGILEELRRSVGWSGIRTVANGGKRGVHGARGRRLASPTSKTLGEALAFSGGKSLNGAAQILLRAGVAALLTASKGLDYPLSATDVLGQVNMALASDRAAMTSLAATLGAYNNLGCLDASSNPLACLK